MRSVRRLHVSVLLSAALLCGCVGASTERYAAEVQARARVVGEELDQAFADASRDGDPLRASRRLERLSRLSNQLQSVQMIAPRASKSWDYGALDRASETLTGIEDELGISHTD